MSLTLPYNFANGDALDAAKIQANFVAIEAKFGAIGTTDLAADAVTGAKIADDAVDNEHIAADAVEAAQIDDDAVVAAGINDDIVDSQHYAAASVDWEHLHAETPNVWTHQFTGTGASLSITGCPFTPTLVLVIPLEAVSGVTIIAKESTAMAGSDSIRLTDGAILTTAITAITSDGFTVGAAILTTKEFLGICVRSKGGGSP